MYKGFVTDTEKKEEPKIDNKIRQEWNNYVQYLGKKGLRGHASLDKDDFGGKMIDEYRKEHPDTPITRELIIPIQKDFTNYRKYSLDEIKAGRLSFADGVNEDNFMKNLSIVDGIAGQRTTSFEYPLSYLKTLDEKDNVVEVENKGFAKTNK